MASNSRLGPVENPLRRELMLTWLAKCHTASDGSPSCADYTRRTQSLGIFVFGRTAESTKVRPFALATVHADYEASWSKAEEVRAYGLDIRAVIAMQS